MTTRPLIALAVRRYFRDMSAGWSTLREIGNMWQDEGFIPSGEPNDEQGERRGLWREYEDGVDWTDTGTVTRVLRVYEALLEGVTQDGLDRCGQILQRNGLTLTPDRRIVLVAGHLSRPPPP